MNTTKKQGCLGRFGAVGIVALGLSWGCTEMPDYMRGEESNGLAVMAAQLAQGGVHDSGDGVREVKKVEAKPAATSEHEIAVGKTAAVADKGETSKVEGSMPSMPVVTLDQTRALMVRNTETIPVTPY